MGLSFRCHSPWYLCVLLRKYSFTISKMASYMNDFYNEAAANMWTNKKAYEVAENRVFGGDKSAVPAPTQSKAPVNGVASAAPADLIARITKLEGENHALTALVDSLGSKINEVLARLQQVEASVKKGGDAPAKEAPKVEEKEDDDDDVDLFGSDDEEEDAEAARIREERLKAYAEKKSKKVGPIAKSSILLDVKPWDDETDLKIMEANIRTIEMDGLVWGAAKTVPLAFGINKLTILCTVEDEKVSVDDLIEKIEADEDFVQSVDINAFNKI